MSNEPLHKTDIQPVAANGSELHSLGEIMLTVKIGSETTIHTFHVVEELESEILVGNDLMKKLGLKIDFEKEVIINRDGTTVPMNIYKKSIDMDSHDQAVVKKTMWLPARSKNLVTLIVPRNENNEKREIYTPLQTYCESKVYVPSGIIDGRSEVIVEVVNVCKFPVKIKQGRTLAWVSRPRIEKINIVDFRKPSPPEMTFEERERVDEETVCKMLDTFDLDTDSALTKEEKSMLRQFLKKNAKTFAANPSRPGRTSKVQHTIDTGENAPFRMKRRRMPWSHQQIEQKHIKEMLENGIVRRSSSPWASPIVLADKPDGSIRFCVDYRELNKITKKDSYPLPRIEETIDKLRGMNYLSTLDLASGFWQVAMDDKDREKTAFISSIGLFEFNVMPFGLCNSPATFQRMMDEVCDGLDWRVGSDYIDDIVIGSSTFEEHLQSLQSLFDRLNEYGLTVKLQKCKFCRTKLLFLGHVVSKDGIMPNPAKTKIVQEMKPPTDLKGLRRFLGVTGYYRRFIKDYAKIAKPLTTLLKKGNLYRWNESCQQAFCELKKSLTSSPILIYPNFKEKFILKTDASKRALGAALCQELDGMRHVIAYWSRTLRDGELRYTITELEMLALVDAIQHFNHYLGGGAEFIAITDHQALKWLMTSHHSTTPRLQRWQLKLMFLNMTVEYRPGAQNYEADLLSRLDKDNKICLIKSAERYVNGSIYRTKLFPDDTSKMYFIDNKLKMKFTDLKEINHVRNIELAKAQREDEDFKELITYLESNQMPDDHKRAMKLTEILPKFEWKDGLLYRVDLTPRMMARGIAKARICVPKIYREDVLQVCHNSLFAGHLGVKKTYNRIQHDYFWPKMSSDVKAWLESCMECAMKKGTPHDNIGKMGHLWSNEPLDIVACDIIGPLPITERGNRYILTFTDHFSRYVEAFPIQKQDADTIADHFVRQFCCRHGVPKKFISDRGRQLIGEIMSAIHQKLQVQQLKTASYRPQGNAIAERVNKTLTGILAMFVSEHQKDWDYLLPFAVFAYNTSVHDGIKETPYYVMNLRDPNSPLPLLRDEDIKIPNESVSNYTRRKTQLSEQMKDAIREYDEKVIQHRLKTHERIQKESKLMIGDLVWLYIKQQSKDERSKKLKLPWKGPFRIDSFNSETQVVLKDLTTNKQLAPVHISRLKRYNVKRPGKSEVPDMEGLSNEEKFSDPIKMKMKKENREKEYDVEKILDNMIDDKDQTWYKLRWTGYSPKSDSWVKGVDLHSLELLRDYCRRKGVERKTCFSCNNIYETEEQFQKHINEKHPIEEESEELKRPKIRFIR